MCDGSRCGTWIGEWGTTIEDLDLSRVRWAIGTAGRVLDPSWLLGLLELDTPRHVTYDGRDAVRGRPRYALPWPFGPAEEHELVVDPKRGTLYRLTGYLSGSEAFVHELVELEHDAAFDDATFVIPGTGEVSGLGLREAAALVDFQLWALPLPVVDVTYRPEPVASVTLTSRDAWLVQTDASVPQMRAMWREPEVVERGGRSYWLAESSVRFVVGGTSVDLVHATATGDDLIAVAEALVPVA